MVIQAMQQLPACWAISQQYAAWSSQLENAILHMYPQQGNAKAYTGRGRWASIWMRKIAPRPSRSGESIYYCPSLQALTAMVQHLREFAIVQSRAPGSQHHGFFFIDSAQC